ncbi:hypothetical protein [Streptomyces sp. NPDC093591]|uniref:hypothetical protein n=1 Tax=Streptomyces sp. NPDC093591 TaxID=3366044 RepID=UPI003809E173
MSPGSPAQPVPRQADAMLVQQRAGQPAPGHPQARSATGIVSSARLTHPPAVDGQRTQHDERRPEEAQAGHRAGVGSHRIRRPVGASTLS